MVFFTSWPFDFGCRCFIRVPSIALKPANELYESVWKSLTHFRRQIHGAILEWDAYSVSKVKIRNHLKGDFTKICYIGEFNGSGCKHISWEATEFLSRSEILNLECLIIQTGVQRPRFRSHPTIFACLRINEGQRKSFSNVINSKEAFGSCPICLREIEEDEGLIPGGCSHTMCNGCLIQWVQQKDDDARCPVCRTGFSSVKLVARNRDTDMDSHIEKGFLSLSSEKKKYSYWNLDDGSQPPLQFDPALEVLAADGSFFDISKKRKLEICAAAFTALSVFLFRRLL